MLPLDDQFFDFKLPPGRPYQVVSLGMNAVDWICRLPVYPPHNSKIQMDSMIRMGGGPAATAAALCARYGLQVKYVGRVGDDEIGLFSLQDLKREKMDVSSVEMIPAAASQFAVILVDRPSGERTVLWRYDPKLNYEGDLRRQWVTCGQVLHLDGEDLPSRLQAARWAKKAGMQVCLDIERPAEGVEELLRLADFPLPTEKFVCSLAGTSDCHQALRSVSEIAGGFVGATRGGRGVAVCWQGEVIEIPSFPVRVVESTGAGDVFHGAFAYSLFQGWSLRRCLRFGNAAGALACTRLGARGGIPPLQEVLQMLKDHPE